jgi:hypothetical protein
MKNVDSKLLGKNREFIYKDDFVALMGISFKELNERLLDITSKCEILSLQVKQNRIPDYLQPGNHFLGQYMITEVISQKRILQDKLMGKPSVFSKSDNEYQFINENQ